MWREEVDGGARERNGGVTERGGGSREKDGSSSERDGSASERDGDERERNAAGKREWRRAQKGRGALGEEKRCEGMARQKIMTINRLKIKKIELNFCGTK